VFESPRARYAKPMLRRGFRRVGASVSRWWVMPWERSSGAILQAMRMSRARPTLAQGLSHETAHVDLLMFSAPGRRLQPPDTARV
jgi:hypothetical protein